MFITFGFIIVEPSPRIFCNWKGIKEHSFTWNNSLIGLRQLTKMGQRHVLYISLSSKPDTH